MDETRRLARFVSELDYEMLPEAVVAHAKRLLLDQLGCQIAFAALPWNRSVLEVVRAKHSPAGESTVAYYGLRLPADDAAFANAAFGHGFEMDDVEASSASHPGAVVIPSALALAESRRSSGRTLVAAIVGGYEAMLRASAGAPGLFQRGFHPTSALGPFGAAAAAARIVGLDAETTNHALGIAGSGAAGTCEFSSSGGGVKRVYAAFAAHFGVRAALLARAGITGPGEILEGAKGFCRALSDEQAPEEIGRGLGEDFKILATGFKPYCCCGAYHSALDAVDMLAGGGRIDLETVDEIVVEQMPREVSHVGRIVEPRTVTEAQFSARFGVAMRFIKGSNGLHDYTEEGVGDEAILRLARKIDYRAETTGERLDKPGSAIVTLSRKDGTVSSQRVDFPRGSPRNPMSTAEVEAKFRELVSRALAPGRADEIVGFVNGLEAEEDVSRLAGLLAAEAIEP